MANPWEEFFIRKIAEGLAARGLSLAPDEEQLLRTSVLELPRDGAERGRELLQKAVGALSEAYARDTADKNRQEVLRWRDNIGAMHKHSQLFVSAVMQEWYLSAGRAQEKRASGCLPVLVLLCAVAAVFVAALTALL